MTIVQMTWLNLFNVLLWKKIYSKKLLDQKDCITYDDALENGVIKGTHLRRINEETCEHAKYPRRDKNNIARATS